jgi:hypothetical protein
LRKYALGVIDLASHLKGVLMTTDAKILESVNQEATDTQERHKSEQAVRFENLRKKTEALEAQLQERDQQFQKQKQLMEQMQTRIQPARDEFDDLPSDELIDKAKLQKIRERDRENFRKEAAEVARQTYAQMDNDNFATKLKYAYPDYDEIVNTANAEKLQEKDPEFMSLLAEVKDDFKRREMAYKKMKKLAQAEEKPKVKAQDVVDENRKTAGNFFTPSGQGPMNNPYAFEFDVHNPQAKAQAYQKLKAAQKRAF